MFVFPWHFSHFCCWACWIPLSSLLPVAALVIVKKICVLGCSCIWLVLSQICHHWVVSVDFFCTVSAAELSYVLVSVDYTLFQWERSQDLPPPYIVFVQFLGERERCWFGQLFHFRSSYSSSLLFHYDYEKKGR